VQTQSDDSSQIYSSLPSLTYSQESVFSSTPAVNTNRRKRSYDEEIEDVIDGIFDDEEDQVHSLQHVQARPQYPISHSSMPDLDTVSSFRRPLARPKARVKASSIETMKGSMEDFDEEDVEFLQPMDMDV